MAQKKETRHLTITKKLLQEAKPYLVGEPHVRVRPLGEQVRFGEQAGQIFKASLPLMSAKLRPDLLVIHDLPTKMGLVHVIHTYSGSIFLPVETLLTLQGRIPRPVLMKRGGLRSGQWVSSLGGADKDGFCKFLNNLKKGTFDTFEKKIEWDLDLGRSKIKLPWAVQLAPLSEASFSCYFRQPFDTTLFSEYKSSRLAKSFELAGWLQAVIQKANYTGKVASAPFLVPSLGLMALVEE